MEPLPRSGRAEEFLAEAIFAFLLLLSSLKFFGPVQGCQVNEQREHEMVIEHLSLPFNRRGTGQFTTIYSS